MVTTAMVRAPCVRASAPMIGAAGALGTLTVDLVGQFGRLPAPLAWGEGHWVITGGTGAYADLHGRGSWTALADFRAAFAMTGPPTVAFQLTGSTN